MNKHWNRVAEVFESALEQDPGERSAFVQQACAGDRELCDQVEALLAEAQHPEPLAIDGPVGAIIADLLGDDDGVVPGTQLGPYRIESLLGAGGMGEVYRATDTALGRQVAIKVLPPTFSSDPERVARFRREAQILASLNHPNIGAIYGLERMDGQDSQTHGLVLELIEGPTLAETLAARRLSVDEALALARQIASALEAAHEQGVVHRDLKPGNIKVRERRNGQGSRLRAGEGARRGRPVGHGDSGRSRRDRRRRHPGHCRLHVARAGQRKAGRQAQRRLVLRLRHLRNAHRHASFRRR